MVEAWRNRIVDSGLEAPDQLLANPRNWRIHPKRQQEILGQALDEVGWVAGVIVNRRTGFVVDGHLRVALAISRGEASIPVQYVDLDEREEGIVLASFDTITSLATRDAAILRDLVAGLDLEGGPLAEMLTGSALPTYTRKIESPVYEPTGPAPAIADLYDDSRTQDLLFVIDQVPDMPDEVRTFLRAAAARHTSFRFDRIANYYAHASAEVQALMEDSALVIIDAEQAIERGFLQLNADVLEAWKRDNPDAS